MPVALLSMRSVKGFSSSMVGMENILFSKQQQNMVMKTSILFMTRGYTDLILDYNFKLHRGWLQMLETKQE